MKKYIYFSAISLSFLLLILIQINCSSKGKSLSKAQLISRGKYLVNLGGCNDCHSPKIMTAMGPVPDTTRLLSGHPANEPVPSLNIKDNTSNQWIKVSGDLTTWVGPWGVVYTQNLTPDPETGLGDWTPELFIKAIRTGKHMGVGRPILPPMPWQSFRKLKDNDLRAIFAYLHSLPPVKNKVPAPVPPGKLPKFANK